ncbi:hypothetical protein Leryth_027104 [Lithospermum erythrorhizon]|nr:hypothetical protein Leryth_027104 [Lithospermum erythrorhizon]
MHPIFKILNPTMRYTMEINALSRLSELPINKAYEESMWLVNLEVLPADLIRRSLHLLEGDYYVAEDLRITDPDLYREMASSDSCPKVVDEAHRDLTNLIGGHQCRT